MILDYMEQLQKTNTKNRIFSEKIFRNNFFFCKKLESLAIFLVANKIFTVSELHSIKMIKELFKQLPCDKPTQNIDVLKNIPIQYPTRLDSKGFLSSKYNRTVYKEKFVGKYLDI